MKLLKIMVAPGERTVTEVVPILNRELSWGAPNVMEWHRLFDPELDPRITLENIARAARAEGVRLLCDGQDATLACILREDGEASWSLIVMRDQERAWDNDVQGDMGPTGRYHHTLWLILQDDDQAERITRELAALDPEASRFTLRRGN